MDLLHVFHQGDLVLITTFLLLIVMSIISWFIIFWKGWVLKKEARQLEDFKAKYIKTADWPRNLGVIDVEGAVCELIEEAREVRKVITKDGLKERKELLTVHLSQALDRIRLGLDRGLTILASIGSAAPFVGLFGTVWGIYIALANIASKGSASLNVVAGPMGEALVATAMGLFAAIPAVLAYNTFLRSNRVLVQNLRHISEQLTLYLYKQSPVKNALKIKSDKKIEAV